MIHQQGGEGVRRTTTGVQTLTAATRVLPKKVDIGVG
jgi:hypothetical protein